MNGEITSVRGIPVTVDYISSASVIRPGLLPETKKYIVIHNTGNYNPSCDAAWHNKYIHEQAASETPRKASWHYSVDDISIWQHIPLCESAWHASDGDYGNGNYYGIGIELCVNGFPGVYSGADYDEWEKYFRKVIENGAALTAELMKLYGIGEDGILQHYDTARDKKNCPMQMRYDKSTGEFSRTDGTLYNYFLERVAAYGAKA